METTKYSIAERYTKYPGIRFSSQSTHSGEDFFETVLKNLFEEAVKKDKKLEIILDGTAGYAPSFLDEAFGRLVLKFGAAKVKKHLSFISTEEPEWPKFVENDVIPIWEKKRTDKK